jgi:hypothetical protein
LATTCTKNEQQQDGKNNAELQTKWQKMTWKTFEEILRRARNRSVEAQLAMMMMMMMMMTILSPSYLYLVSSTNHEVLHYAVFSNLSLYLHAQML